ncbi:putative DNA-binding protein [Trypanosoma grayi]|uniref:putative DNA-binding protein n=1 Tax=Trypanosoma grayi TaxID=71804 RepID=UPI0004F42908|nr:putative DNA-binding protein [Trypanosoma grayi]KEG13161.1 putative DNA-binding protein [Trypanosoma grayi]
MTDVDTRVERLKGRIKRKRDDVHRYLEAAFYHQCRNVLNAVIKHDVNGVFATNPAELPEYAVRVSHPMWWKLISKRLDKYDYADKMEFVHDMRLVVENCYAYNGSASPVSALGCRLEVEMEDLFLTELAVAPPDVREILRLGKGLNHAQARQLWLLINRYEDQGQGNAAARQHIAPSQLKCATQRRVLAFLRRAVGTNEHNGRAERAPPVQQPQQQQQQRPPRAAKPQAPQYPTRSILEADADVEFSSDQKAEQNIPPEPQLDRVPQNQRAGLSAFKPVSPIHLGESSEEEELEDLEDSETVEKI